MTNKDPRPPITGLTITLRNDRDEFIKVGEDIYVCARKRTDNGHIKVTISAPEELKILHSRFLDESDRP